MKARLLIAAIACGVVLVANAHAQPSGGKSGGRKGGGSRGSVDPALQEFLKVYNDPKGKFDQARFHSVIAAGFTFLTKSPTHAQAVGVVNDVANFGRLMNDKALAPMRAYYVSLLRYEIVNQRGKEGVSPEAQTAIAALDAALADFEARLSMSRENLGTLRDKIDKLTPMLGASRFLVNAERSYADLLSRGGRGGPAAAEAHLRKLLQHPDKELAGLAQTDLNMLELSKAPFEAKFAALDGKEVDFAKLRGKVIAAVYFRASDEGAARYFERLKEFQSEHRRRGFEVVAVSFDPAADRAKVEKWVKDKKVAFPVYFDGKEAAGDFGPKLGVQRAPSVVLIDAKGFVVGTNVPPDRLEPSVRQLLGVKEPAPVAMEEPVGGGGGRRR